CRRWPVAASHRAAVVSAEAVASRRPSGLNCTRVTALLCRRVRSGALVGGPGSVPPVSRRGSSPKSGQFFIAGPYVLGGGNQPRMRTTTSCSAFTAFPEQLPDGPHFHDAIAVGRGQAGAVRVEGHPVSPPVVIGEHGLHPPGAAVPNSHFPHPARPR